MAQDKSCLVCYISEVCQVGDLSEQVSKIRAVLAMQQYCF